MPTPSSIRLDDPIRDAAPYRQGMADFQANRECPFDLGSDDALLWAAGWLEEDDAAQAADRAEAARMERYFDEREVA